MKLPNNHPSRYDLSNEVHARPPFPVSSPVTLSCLAVTTDWPYRKEDRDIVVALTCLYEAPPPPAGAKHYTVDLGEFSLIWERHTEFTRYTFVAKGDPNDPFAKPAIKKAPREWLASIPGQVIAAVNATMVDAIPEGEDWAKVSQRYFGGNALIGSRITGGAGIALTDFRIQADDFSRILILNRSMGDWHAGRIVQRLLEIEVYRVLALLALPVAQRLNPDLMAAEQELTQITTQMTESDHESDQAMLDRLMTLQAQVERSVTESQYRFSAASAYDAIVAARISELREERIEGMQTFQEFVDRRLRPALNTCQSVARRQRDMSERVKRSSQLLLTQVEMSLEQQNQDFLESMDRRSDLQLRLQKTVEGLSVAAITYYIVGVIGYVAKGFDNPEAGFKASQVIAISVPIVLLFVALGLRRMRKHLETDEEQKPVTRATRPPVSTTLETVDH